MDVKGIKREHEGWIHFRGKGLIVVSYIRDNKPLDFMKGGSVFGLSEQLLSLRNDPFAWS
jgi:hypothetical protein